MSESNNSRRDFLKTTGAVAATSGVLSAVTPVHAAVMVRFRLLWLAVVVAEQVLPRMP